MTAQDASGRASRCAAGAPDEWPSTPLTCGLRPFALLHAAGGCPYPSLAFPQVAQGPPNYGETLRARLKGA